MTSSITWFDKSLDPDRVQRLSAWRSYGEILNAMHEQAEIRLCRWEPFTEQRLAGCKRIVFGITLTSELHDAFFNSPAGYRAQYAKSPDEGTAGNRLTIDRFIPDLVGVARDLHIGPDAHVLASLEATQAKIWIDESEAQDQQQGAACITWRRWKTVLGTGIGLRAPLGECLEIKGGWVDHEGVAKIDGKKVSRSTDIHASGYT